MAQAYTDDELHTILESLSKEAVVQSGKLISLTDDGFTYDARANCESAYQVLDDDGDVWYLTVGEERLWDVVRVLVPR